LGHRILHDVFAEFAAVRSGPVWPPMPPAVGAAWEEEISLSGTDAAAGVELVSPQ
jgi:hypothetical protein